MNKKIDLRQQVLDLIYEEPELDRGIESTIAFIGQTFNISRVYIFENNEENTHSNNTYEWCASGIEPQKDELQNMSFEEYDYQSMFDENGLFFCPDIRTLPPMVKDLLESQGIQATMQYAIYDKGVFRGIVGFDDCVNPHPEWDNDGVSLKTLIYVSRLLSISLLKERNLENAVRLHTQLEKSLKAEKELRETAIKATTAKTYFLSRISHDMRTPLNGILGITALLKDSIGNERAQKDLRQLETSGRYLLHLINDTLDISKIESGKIELHPTVCDGRAVFYNIISLIRPNIEAKRIQFNIHTENFGFTMLRIDVGRVEQIVMNILSNAVKFTPEGGRIDFTLANLSIEEGVVTDEIVIRDSGIGMSPDFLPRLFEPFSQENSERAGSAQGSGLGMAISKQLVELMGGKIRVESEPGKGTTFTLTIPMKIASEKEVDTWTVTKSVGNGEVTLAGKKVLLCEDHPLNANIAIRLLAKRGVEVELAENGSVGVAMFLQSEQGYYDAILMDIRMPVMDGLDAAHTIRHAKRKDAKTIPIIAMTANAFDEDIRRSKEAGMDAHLGKPVEPEKLYAALEQILRLGRVPK